MGNLTLACNHKGTIFAKHSPETLATRCRMMKDETQKIVIIEKNPTYRDYLRTIISGHGGLS